MTPNPKIREIIMSMGIIPESEHYDIAEAVIRECANVAADHEALDIYEEIREHFGVEE